MPSIPTVAAPSKARPPTTITAHADDPRDERHERRRPAVAERVVRRARTAGTRCTRRARRRATRARPRGAARRRPSPRRRTPRPASVGYASAIISAVTGTTSSDMLSSAQRSERANADGSSASRARSERIAVCTGWARIAYGARKNTNATWYATVPPLTLLPTTIAAPSSKPTIVCWNTAHPDSRTTRRTSASWRPRRGTSRKPLRHAATTGSRRTRRRRACRRSRGSAPRRW